MIRCGTHLHKNFSGIGNSALWVVTGKMQSTRAVPPRPCEGKRRIFEEMLEKNHGEEQTDQEVRRGIVGSIHCSCPAPGDLCGAGQLA